MERKDTMPVADVVADAVADARTLIVNSRPQYGDALWTALTEGSRAVVACLDGNERMAAFHAREAAHAAFRFVPGLR